METTISLKEKDKTTIALMKDFEKFVERNKLNHVRFWPTGDDALSYTYIDGQIWKHSKREEWSFLKDNKDNKENK